MKSIFPLFLALLMFSTMCCAAADDFATNEWGPVTCNAQMFVQLKGPDKELKTNQPINLIIRIKNVSTNENLHVFQSLAIVVDSYANFSFVIISPSGKDISPKQAKYWNGGSAVDFFIPPGQTKEFNYNLNHVCKFNEIGAYKVIVKKRFGIDLHDKSEISSNPLTITVSQ